MRREPCHSCLDGGWDCSESLALGDTARLLVGGCICSRFEALTWLRSLVPILVVDGMPPEHPRPVMRLEDLIRQDLTGVPSRVSKSVKSIKPMPMPYDLLPSEMRARSAKERQERRRLKKKNSATGLNAHERSQSLLHWAWEPSLSDSQIALSLSANSTRPRRRRLKKPVSPKPVMVVDTEEDRTEMLRLLQERQVMRAARKNVEITAKRSAQECETTANNFTPSTGSLPDFYLERLILDGERKPGQSRVDCRRRRKRRDQAPARQWTISRAVNSNRAMPSHSRTDAAVADTAAVTRNGKWTAPPEPEPKPEPTQALSESPSRASSPITIIPKVAAESPFVNKDHQQVSSSSTLDENGTVSPATVADPEPESRPGASLAAAEPANAAVTDAISPPKVISHKVGPPGLDIPAGWECGEVGVGSYYFFHIDDPGKIYWDGPPWLDGQELVADNDVGDIKTHDTEPLADLETNEKDPVMDATNEPGYPGVDDPADAAALAAIDAELAALDRSLGHSAVHVGAASQLNKAPGITESMASVLEDSRVESESVSSVSEAMGNGSDGYSSDEFYTFDGS